MEMQRQSDTKAWEKMSLVLEDFEKKRDRRAEQVCKDTAPVVRTTNRINRMAEEAHRNMLAGF